MSAWSSAFSYLCWIIYIRCPTFLSWAYTVWFSPFFNPIIEPHNSLRVGPNFGFVRRRLPCSVQGERGPIICLRMAIGLSDEFLTCPKFWPADSGSRIVEAEQRLDSPTSARFSSLRLLEVANRAPESHGDMQLHNKGEKRSATEIRA